MGKEQVIAATDTMALAQLERQNVRYRNWIRGTFWAEVTDLSKVSDNPKLKEATRKSKETGQTQPKRISSVVGRPDGNALAAADGKVAVFAHDRDREFRESRTLPLAVGSNVALAVDGDRMGLVDPDAGTLRLVNRKNGASLTAKDGLSKPRRVALRNGRLFVYESGAQRIAEFIVRE